MANLGLCLIFDRSPVELRMTYLLMRLLIRYFDKFSMTFWMMRLLHF